MFATLEVYFVAGGMKGNMVKCRICKFVKVKQTSTLTISKMDFLQLKISICQLKSQRAPFYAPSKDKLFPKTKKIFFYL